MKAYTFLDIEQFPIAWEVYCGELISTNATVTNSVRPMSVFEANRFRKKQGVWYNNELIIDDIRANNYPSKISRLTGMYFFEDKDSALKAAKDVRWGDRYYNANYLVEVELSPKGDVTKVDHDWIFEKKVPVNPIDKSQTDWIHKYWKGEAFNSSDPLWELIMEGTVKILDEKFKDRAFKVVEKKQPDTLAILELSRIGRDLEYQLGHIVSWVKPIPNSTEKAQVVYIIKMEEKETKKLLEQVKSYEKPKKMDLISDKSRYKIPELRDEFFDIPII